MSVFGTEATQTNFLTVHIPCHFYRKPFTESCSDNTGKNMQTVHDYSRMKQLTTGRPSSKSPFYILAFSKLFKLTKIPFFPMEKCWCGVGGGIIAPTLQVFCEC